MFDAFNNPNLNSEDLNKILMQNPLPNKDCIFDPTRYDIPFDYEEEEEEYEEYEDEEEY